MTVAELIAALEKMPQDADAQTRGVDNCGDSYPISIDEVSLEDGAVVLR